MRYSDSPTLTSAFHCWPPSIRCARPHGLELLAGQPPHTAGLESFRQRMNTYYSRAQCIKDFVTIALYKFTFTIPYHTIPTCHQTVAHLN